MTAALKYLKGCPMEDFSFLFVGLEGRNWDQWVGVILTQILLNMRKNSLTIRISNNGNHFLGMQWCVNRSGPLFGRSIEAGNLALNRVRLGDD